MSDPAATGRVCAPIAVVALGDPSRHDDGLALRVMGRVRTVIAEIGCSRGGAGERPRRRKRRARATDVLKLGTAGSLVLGSGSPPERESGAGNTPRRQGSLIEWVEGGTASEKLDGALGGRRRVVLIDSVRVTGIAGTVHHWHLECDPRRRLTSVRHYNGASKLGLKHLALWLEDELPERGTDLIGIEPHDLSEGEGISRRLRTKLPAICAQVTGILVKILEEEGW